MQLTRKLQNVQGGPAEVSETIELGKMSVRAGVSVIFELKSYLNSILKREF